jgi:salicylate hydroxylase
MEDGEKQRERDAWLLFHPGSEEGHINIRSDKVWLDELLRYDAYQVRTRFWERYQTEAWGGIPQKLGRRDVLVCTCVR